jgi:hypothetical protein
LIYIGEHQTVTKDDELNGIVEKFKEQNKAIYVSSKEFLGKLFSFLIYFRSIAEWKSMKSMKISKVKFLNISKQQTESLVQ